MLFRPLYYIQGRGALDASGGASVTDNFNRADGAIGANWTNLQNSIDIVSNTAQGGSTGNNSAYRSAETFSADHFSQATIVLFGNSNAVAVRMQSGPTFYIFNNDGSSTDAKMYKCVAGSFTQIGADYTGLSIGIGTVLKLSVSGTTLTPSVDGTPLATRTDSDISGGAPGMYIFSNDHSLDNWSGGPTV